MAQPLTQLSRVPACRYDFERELGRCGMAIGPSHCASSGTPSCRCA